MKDEPVFEYHANEVLIEVELPDSSIKRIKINSGWSFGTGEHETTRLCLKALEQLFKTENIQSVLDIGCGSGILSIASAVLGASTVKGNDIDFSIVEEARTNSRNNNVLDKIQFTTQPITKPKKKVDLITANILLQTIKFLLPDISENVVDNGFFIASGIRKSEQDEGIQIIESFGFKTKKTYSENEWVALLFEKGV
jgi:ribosomal protein L11 methyltransferase